MFYQVNCEKGENNIMNKRQRKKRSKLHVLDENGNIIVTKLSAETLRAISSNGNGIFFNITPRNSEIFEILKQISFLEKNKYKTTYYEKFKDQYHIFCILILILLVIDTLIYPKHHELKRNN